MTDYVFTEHTNYNPADGFALADGSKVILEEALGVDHTATGFTINDAVAGENVAFPDLCYFKSDGKFWKADADASATTEGELAIALESITADSSGEFLKLGYLRDDSWSFTVGAILYVSTTSGGITATKPTGIGDCIRRIGHAHAANIVWFGPDLFVLEL